MSDAKVLVSGMDFGMESMSVTAGLYMVILVLVIVSVNRAIDRLVSSDCIWNNVLLHKDIDWNFRHSRQRRPEIVRIQNDDCGPGR